MENSKIILSIVVPVYNVAPYLRKCVDSLLAQDYDDYEIILVDDGSTDNSGEICGQIVESQKSKVKSDNLSSTNPLTHSPVIKVIHQENAGLSAARNSGIKIAEGEYICFVDSDDYWQPNVLGALMAQVERDELDVLRFRLQYVRVKEDSRESKIEKKYEVFNPYKNDPFAGNDYSTDVTDGVTFLNTRMNTQCYAWTFIIRRDLIVESGESNVKRIKSRKNNEDSLPYREGVGLGHQVLFTEGIYFEDTDWTPRMLVKAQRVASTDIVVYNYLMREGSITNAINRDKQRKVLDDKMRLIGALQEQAKALREQGKETSWFGRMIAATVVSIIGILSTQFYAERKGYIAQLQQIDIWPLHIGNSPKGDQSAITNLKLKLINLSPRLAVKILHYKNRK